MGWLGKIFQPAAAADPESKKHAQVSMTGQEDPDEEKHRRVSTLDPDEKNIYEMLKKGYSLEETSAKLDLPLNVVWACKEDILFKLGVDSIPALITLYGLLDIGKESQ
ncbi:MAG: hypothetical protein HGA22_13935 [Clostridiales bacterium]|nr:hypothetical protein [Clostridiales bacterium]